MYPSLFHTKNISCIYFFRIAILSLLICKCILHQPIYGRSIFFIIFFFFNLTLQYKYLHVASHFHNYNVIETGF